jgi:hypothetical protein
MSAEENLSQDQFNPIADFAKKLAEHVSQQSKDLDKLSGLMDERNK